jgi:hypothetical protein
MTCTHTCTHTHTDLEDPNGTLALRLEIEVPYAKKHPFKREYDALEAMMPHHGNIVALWHGWSEEGIVPKVAKALPQFILTRFEDKISLKPDWVPKVRRWQRCVTVCCPLVVVMSCQFGSLQCLVQANYTLLDYHPEHLQHLRPLLPSPLPLSLFLAWAMDISGVVLAIVVDDCTPTRAPCSLSQSRLPRLAPAGRGELVYCAGVSGPVCV